MNEIARIRDAAQQLLQKLEPIERLVGAVETKQDFYPQVASAIDECLAQLAELRMWGPENRLPSSELWNVAGDLLARGWLQNQARTKPRGYAGDYEMLARIYKNRLCDDPLGRLFDRYFQAQAAPQAVRNRMATIADRIVAEAAADQRSHHISVVGFAFGLEICDALARLDDAARGRTHVTLVDIDPAAIDFAREQLQPRLKPVQLTATSTNLFRLPDRPAEAKQLRGSHLMFCPGMFDYLDDAAATGMLRCLYQQLVSGGRLMVFQFAPHNPTRAYMEWFGNWYLTYREEAAFRELVESADLADAVATYGAEPLGIDLFVTIRRP